MIVPTSQLLTVFLHAFGEAMDDLPRWIGLLVALAVPVLILLAVGCTINVVGWARHKLLPPA